LLDPQNGDVLVDGQNVKDLKLESLRKYITIIPQNGSLFNETILFNLLYGRPDAKFEEIVEIAKKCQLHDSIMVFYKFQITKIYRKSQNNMRPQWENWVQNYQVGNAKEF